MKNHHRIKEILSTNHFEMLSKESCISEEVIIARGYKTISNKNELAELGFSSKQQRPGLLIPVWTTDGQNGLNVLRPDNPRVVQNTKKKNPDGTYPSKEIKYEFPKNSAMRLDCPPTCREMLKDPLIPLWITEGTKKADSLASKNQCAIALLGVWNFKGRNEFGGTTLLADFDHIAFENRDVRIVFDSDVMTKSQVRQALDRLTEHIQRKKAHVSCVYLPNDANGGKKWE